MGNFQPVLTSIAAGGTAYIAAPNVGSLSEGYVLLNLPVGVNGYGVFRQSIPGQSDQEAVVPFSGATSLSSILAFDETSFTTGVAIVNPSSVATTVAVRLSDLNGNVIGTSSINLQPYAKTESALRALPGLGGMVGKVGSAQFTAGSGSVSVLGLRFGATAFTSIPLHNNSSR